MLHSPSSPQQVFNLTSDDHVITIASAGCNVLDYIIEGARVTAVDFNACQIALTELKATAIKELDFDDFFAIFAKNDIELLRNVYPKVLRPNMSKPSVDFWDLYVKKITSFMYSGKSSGSYRNERLDRAINLTLVAPIHLYTCRYLWSLGVYRIPCRLPSP